MALSRHSAAGEGSGALRPAVQARLVVAAVLACALLALFWPRGRGSFEAPGGFLVDGGGRPTPLGTRLAPVTLVHFWATWCPPCLTEVPALNRLASDLAEEPAFRLVMVAVADSADKVQAFLGARGAGVLYDPNWEVARRYGTDKLPETYLVVGGEVVEVFEGATDWDDPEVRARIRRALDRSGRGTGQIAEVVR